MRSRRHHVALLLTAAFGVAACGRGAGTPNDAGAGGRGGSSGAGSGGAPAGGTLAARVCPGGTVLVASGSPVPAGATTRRIASVPPKDVFNDNGNDFGIIEGVVWAGDALYLSEIASGANPPPARILKVVLPDVVSIVSTTAGTNGLILNGRGGLLGASHSAGGIIDITLPAGSSTGLVTQYNGTRFNAPNDIALRADGNLYFSDPDYQAPSTRPQQQTRVYRVAPGTNVVTVVDATRRQPNGVTLSFDENTLFVSGADGIFSYPVLATGEVGPRARLSTMAGDGMAIDCAGRLYVASNASVVVVDPMSGAVVASIPLGGVQSATNVAFGGADRKTLFITALGSGGQQGLFQLGLDVPGLPY